MGLGYVSFAFTHRLHLHMRPTQNGVDFAYNISEYIFMDEMFAILIQISLNFVPNWPQISIGPGNG